jgi:phage tail-like protein
MSSTYLRHLPAILQQGGFIGPFLLAFERVLSGPKLTADDPPGIEEVLDDIRRYFDPEDTPADFLPWLAGWVAVSLRDDWSEASRREFLSKIVPLYKKRGTRTSMLELLRIFVREYFGLIDLVYSDDDVQVLDHDGDADPPYFTDDSPPHVFRVVLNMPGNDPQQLARTTRIVRAVIEQEKPAHTYYAFEIQYQAMQINDTPGVGPFGPGIKVGFNTVLGNKS